MIRAVLWDFGGVLTSSPFEAFNRFEQKRGLPGDFIRGINATNPQDNAWARFERSDIDLNQFDQAFRTESSAAGHPVGGAEIIALLSGDLRPRMVAALKTISATHKTACLTNNVSSGEGPGMQATSQRASAVQDVMDLFDAVIESSKVGVRKPDPRFYQMACDALSIDAADAVFLDDLGINLKPARAMGMRTIKVINEDQALSELSALLGIAF